MVSVPERNAAARQIKDTLTELESQQGIDHATLKTAIEGFRKILKYNQENHLIQGEAIERVVKDIRSLELDVDSGRVDTAPTSEVADQLESLRFDLDWGDD
ncbi:MAG: hypothetical protein WBA31_03600 [Candidatus Dormiibacterota bacterium]